jgi:TolB-like protein
MVQPEHPHGLAGPSGAAVRSRPFVALLLLSVAVAACAPGLQPVSQPTPAEIPGLEARLADGPVVVPVLVRLGLAYRSADRMEDARRTLEQAVAADGADPAAVLYLGLTYEELGRPADARRLYQRYLEVGRSRELVRWIGDRIPALQRQELVLAARDAVVREAELANTPPRPRHVAVFPFIYTGTDPQYQPLSRALAEMLVTDLSQTDRLTVLERLRVQLLLDELELAERGVVDMATAARGGRLLGAEHAVQGRVDATDAQVQMEAAIVRVAEAAQLGTPVAERDALRQLFDVQKRLTLELYRELGVELTPAERERVLRQPTTNLEALLAFGRGIEAEDGGNFAAAAEQFRRAATLDGGFQQAVRRAESAAATAVAAAVTGDRLAELGLEEVAVGAEAAGEPLGTDVLEMLVPDAMVRDAVAEVRGQEGFGRRAVLGIILRRP